MNSKSNERRGRVLTFMLSMGMLAGVLIWAKLRLVTDIPRSALAIPEEVEARTDDQGNELIDMIEVEFEEDGWDHLEESEDEFFDGSESESVDEPDVDD